ncbi:MAG: hypothetical protein ACKO0V_19065 [bacterium]
MSEQIQFKPLIEMYLKQLCLAPGILPGRVIEICQKPLRRRLRGFTSGRVEMTDSARLFAGLAWLEPHRLIGNQTAISCDIKHLSRLKRTWNEPMLRHQWAVTQGVRLLAAIEKAASQCRLESRWIIEGLDHEKLRALLAIPDDHVLIGFLAVDGCPSDPACIELMDYEGFFGSPANSSQ